jgi:hypothetical protein
MFGQLRSNYSYLPDVERLLNRVYTLSEPTTPIKMYELRIGSLLSYRCSTYVGCLPPCRDYSRDFCLVFRLIAAETGRGRNDEAQFSDESMAPGWILRSPHDFQVRRTSRHAGYDPCLYWETPAYTVTFHPRF